MKTKIAAVLFLIFMLLVIAAADSGTLITQIRALYNFPYGDKLGHFVMYGILSFLLASAFPRPFSWGRLSVPIVMLVLLIFSTTEEYSQRFFATRTADGIDMICSWLGILSGTWLAVRKQRAAHH